MLVGERGIDAGDPPAGPVAPDVVDADRRVAIVRSALAGRRADEGEAVPVVVGQQPVQSRPVGLQRPVGAGPDEAKVVPR
jgi:hypothetical protein